MKLAWMVFKLLALTLHRPFLRVQAKTGLSADFEGRRVSQRQLEGDRLLGPPPILHTTTTETGTLLHTGPAGRSDQLGPHDRTAPC